MKKEELSKKAIIIIYPDGSIESIDAVFDGFERYHHDYYYTLKDTSEKITNYCDEVIFEMEGHNEVDKSLVLSGCVVILNWDIRSELKEEELSDLSFLIPLTYGSVEQIDKLREILVEYPEIKAMTNVYDPTIERCKNRARDEVFEEMDKQFEKLDSYVILNKKRGE